jgi:hypothetical protein
MSRHRGSGVLTKTGVRPDLGYWLPQGLIMSRVVVIGNAAGGKSTLARQMSVARSLPLVEIDKLLWQDGWRLASPEDCGAQHAAAIARDEWIIERLGNQASIPVRIARATEVLLIDLPSGFTSPYRPNGKHNGTIKRRLPPVWPKSLRLWPFFKTMWEVDRDWLPGIRELCREAEPTKTVTRLCSLEEVDALQAFYRERRS